MNLYPNNLPKGVSVDCLKFPSSIKNIIFTQVSKTFTETTFVQLANWTTEFQTNFAAWMPNDVMTYDDTTDDPTINTAGLGRKVLTRKGTPSGIFYIDSNVCNYNSVIKNFEGGTYRAIFVLEDGTLMGYGAQTVAGRVIKGFKCTVDSLAGFPSIDTHENSYPIFIQCHSTQEFKFRYFDKPTAAWDALIDLPALNWIGVSILQLVSYVVTTEAYEIAIRQPCGQNIATIVLADIDVISSKLAGTAGAAVTSITYSAASQSYVLIFEDGGSVALVAGDIVEYRVKQTSGTFISDNVVITVDAS